MIFPKNYAILLLFFFPPSLYNVQAQSYKDYRQLRYQGVIGQTTNFTCGPAALATLLTHYYNTSVSEQTFTKRSMTDMRARGKKVTAGLTLLSLKNALRSEGIASTGYRLNITQLREVMKVGLPVIANVQYPKGHYYLILGLDTENVLLADPSWGVRSQPIGNFLNAWNGVVLIPQPNETQAKTAKIQVTTQMHKYRERLERLRTGG